MAGPDSVDLRTTYLGLQLSSPIVASAGPLTRDLDGAKALADAGVGALVLPSLFEEEIVAEEVGLSFALEAGSERFAEALDYFPAVTNFTSAADRRSRKPLAPSRVETQTRPAAMDSKSFRLDPRISGSGLIVKAHPLSQGHTSSVWSAISTPG